MASLMTLTMANAAQIRSGRWMLICKTSGSKDYSPTWHMAGVDLTSADPPQLVGYDEAGVTVLRAISILDPHAQLFSVRETEPLKSIFLRSGSVKTLAEAIRQIYDERTGVSLSDVVAREVETHAE